MPQRKRKDDALALREAQKLVKIRGRNVGFDALAEVCGINVENRTRNREVGVALADIRQYAWTETRSWPMPPEGESFEKALAVLIRERAERYREVMGPGTLLTPHALEKWWHDVVTLPGRSRKRGLTPAEISKRYGTGLS